MLRVEATVQGWQLVRTHIELPVVNAVQSLLEARH